MFSFQIHDVAEFLGGDLKTKNQHILVVYKKICKQTASSQSVTIPSSESSSSLKLALQASSILSTSPVLRMESMGQGGGKSPILYPKKGMGRVESQPIATQHLTVQANRLHLSASDPDLRHLKYDDTKLYSGSTGNVKAIPGSPTCRRPLPPPPPGHESTVTQSSSSVRLRAGSMDQKQRKKPSSPRQKRRNSDHNYDLNCSSSSSELEISYQHSSNSFHRQKSADSSGQYRAPSPSNSRSRHRSDSNGSTDSLGELGYNSDKDSNDCTNKKFELMEIDLYILSENSPMFMHLRSTWNNCILVSFDDTVIQCM